MWEIWITAVSDENEDDEDDDELDKEMGDLGGAEADKLDEQVWGSDEEEEEEQIKVKTYLIEDTLSYLFHIFA